MSRYRIIDTDTHLIEPRDLWTSRLPGSWGDDVLHIKWHEPSQQEIWFFGDQPVKSAWRMAMWGFEGRGEIYDGSGPAVQADAHTLGGRWRTAGVL